jgi:cytochrome c oxidase assembly protein subunit 11
MNAEEPMNAPEIPHADPKARRRDFAVAGACGLFAAAMVGMAFAAVPLYDWFCRTTGFAGTPRVAAAAPGQVLDRKIIVRLDANVSGGLPWRFVPERSFVEVRVGDVLTVNYLAINESARETVGQASYNVSPPTVGSYFTKINCFCFTEQRLGPGEKREMPVVFFIEPALAKDAEHDRLNTITLSYTMYRVRQNEPQRVGSVGSKNTRSAN